MPEINIQRRRFTYDDIGNGIPIVFIPGIGGSRKWYTYQESGLSDHYRVICYDLHRSHKHSEQAIASHADNLAMLLSALHIRPAAIVGHSFGGLVALQFAVSYPESCLALVLASTTPSYPNISNSELYSHIMPGQIIKESIIETLIRKIFKKQPAQEKPDIPHLMANTDLSVMDIRLKIMKQSNLVPLLNRVASPSLIVAGSLEEQYILAGSQLMHEKIQKSTLEVIENSDQFYFYSKHDIFNTLLDDYLSHTIKRI